MELVLPQALPQATTTDTFLERTMVKAKEVKRRAGTTFEAWYYRTRTGEVAGVYFRDGEVIAAEESSNARLARLSL